jgi:hypothetical protein
MKHWKAMAALLCVSVLISGSAIVRADDEKKPCCEATVAAGKNCKHECCKKAAADNKVCEKCHPKKEDKL